MEIGDGLHLLPGEDGEIPVRARWVAQGETPEAIAVDGNVVYSADIVIRAFDLADGTVLWVCEGEDAFEASGGVVIGREGPDVIRVFAPFEYDARIDRATGRLITLDSAPAAAVGFTPFPAPASNRFQIEPDLEETVAYWPDGRVAWRLVVDSPFVDPQPPIEVEGVIVYSASGGQIVVLDASG
ncbi:MAG: hypothetical protein ACRD12_18640 [Acidimicrobiales bacterium]